MTPVHDEVVDGRRARSLRTRQAIVDAVIALAQAGEAPTARRVAERAGIAERTLFGHFADLEGLYAEATREHQRRVGRLHPSIEPALPLMARIERFAAQRGDVLEAMTPLRRAVAGLETGSPGLRESRSAWTDSSRVDIQAVFPELRPADGDGDPGLLDVAVAVTSLAFWEELRHGLGLDVAGARRVLARALRQVLAPDC